MNEKKSHKQNGLKDIESGRMKLNPNDYLNAQNSERFVNGLGIQTPVLLDKIKTGKPKVSRWDYTTIKNNKVQKKTKALDK